MFAVRQQINGKFDQKPSRLVPIVFTISLCLTAKVCRYKSKLSGKTKQDLLTQFRGMVYLSENGRLRLISVADLPLNLHRADLGRFLTSIRLVGKSWSISIDNLLSHYRQASLYLCQRSVVFVEYDKILHKI